MHVKYFGIALLSLAVPSNAFVANTVGNAHYKALQSSTDSAESSAISSDLDAGLRAAIRKELSYKPGEAETEFAKRYKHLAGAKVKTVGEAFAEFTKDFGNTVNPLYKNMVTDLVGTTHLIVVNARFQRDPLWSLGIVTTLDLLLKNYPEPEMGQKIVSSLFKCVGMNETEVKNEAQQLLDSVEGMSREDIERALTGEGDSLLAKIAKSAKADKYWYYSRYFGIGLVKIMEKLGMEMDKDEVYPVMEDWMGNKLGKSYLSACADSDLFFKVREKLDMMETMMKEIEIREKKRMAERLEAKAEEALRAAEREEKFQKEIEEEAAKNRERVQSS